MEKKRLQQNHPNFIRPNHRFPAQSCTRKDHRSFRHRSLHNQPPESIPRASSQTVRPRCFVGLGERRIQQFPVRFIYNPVRILGRGEPSSPTRLQPDLGKRTYVLRTSSEIATIFCGVCLSSSSSSSLALVSRVLESTFFSSTKETMK